MAFSLLENMNLYILKSESIEEWNGKFKNCKFCQNIFFFFLVQTWICIILVHNVYKYAFIIQLTSKDRSLVGLQARQVSF